MLDCPCSESSPNCAVATPAGCERLVSGEISVSIRFIGSTIENAIGGELKSSYEQSAVFAATWLEQNT